MSRMSVLRERLERVQQAINGTLDRGAAAYSINGRSVSGFSLDELLKLEDQTRAEIARAGRPGGIFKRGGF